MRDADVDRVAEVFGLLGEPSRLRIVLACLDGPIDVGGIAQVAELSPSLTSHHLRLLRTAHLLRAERVGKFIRYSIDDDHVAEVVRTMIAHVCEPHPHHAAPSRTRAKGEDHG